LKMAQYEIEKHPDYFRTEESNVWKYVLFALIGIVILFILWLASKVF